MAALSAGRTVQPSTAVLGAGADGASHQSDDRHTGISVWLVAPDAHLLAVTAAVPYDDVAHRPGRLCLAGGLGSASVRNFVDADSISTAVSVRRARGTDLVARQAGEDADHRQRPCN